jgi:two-component system, chemotaxis family, sensor kinase CheA
MSGMDEIRAIFEEECREGLDAMESGLLGLESGEDNLKAVNDIFRAAHSIKGGAATFGYSDISQFTHAMETLLDRVRSRELDISPPLLQLFLRCVDSLRDMMAIMDGGDFDRTRAAELKSELDVWIGSKQTGVEAVAGVAPGRESGAEPDPGLRRWRIHFVPKRHLLQTGNQPLALFKALAELGELTVQSDVSALPDIDALDPEELHISWQIEIATDATEQQIAEIFEWVEGDCELDIAPLDEIVVAAGTSGSKAQPQAESELKPRGPDRRSSDRRGGGKDSGSIRVGIDKVDALLNLVGEMVITQAMLGQYARESDNTVAAGLNDCLSQLERNTRELQEAVMQIRMLPVSVTFSRFPRLVHDLSTSLGKMVELRISGEQTELDKTVLEKIGDPLVHLVRNSLDHGIETPEQRRAAGKDPVGQVHLSASHEGGSIVIRVSDDGGGLNTDKILAKARERGLVGPGETPTESQINDLIFHAGFSTADVVSDVSGRGVGMDVVRSNIQDIGGHVEVLSERGRGSTFQITLPLTLAILDGQLVRVATQTYVVPLLAIKETVQIDGTNLNVIAGGRSIYRLRGEAIPVIDMRAVCKVDGNPPLDSYDRRLLMILEAGRRSVGLVVDELLEQSQVVIKSLEANYTKVESMLGATILGDGTVALIVDIPGVVRLGLGGAGSAGN